MTDMADEIPTDYMLAILSEVRLGVPKEESRFKDQPGFSDVWDELAEAVEANPDAIIQIPGELS